MHVNVLLCGKAPLVWHGVASRRFIQLTSLLQAIWDSPASPFLTSVWLSREIKIYMRLFFEWHGTSGPFRIRNFRLGGLFDVLWAQTYAKNSEKSPLTLSITKNNQKITSSTASSTTGSSTSWPITGPFSSSLSASRRSGVRISIGWRIKYILV